jgi:PAS domain S-box-containing protein
MSDKQQEIQDDFLPELPGKKEPTPLRLFLIGILGIVIVELTVMAIVHTIKPQSLWLDSLIDALVLGFVIFPVFYYFAYKVFPDQVARRRRTEAILRKVLENLPVGVWIVDREGKIRHGNLAARTIWAGSRSVGISEYGQFKAWWPGSGKLVEPEEWGATRAILHGETSINKEVEIEDFTGMHKIILNSAAPFYTENGELLGAVIVNQDITSLRQLEKESIQNYELRERFFSSIDTLIAYMDRDFNFIRVNDSYARSAGHPPEFFIGKNHFDLYPHEENQATFQRVVDTGEPYHVQEHPFEYAEFPRRGVTYWNWALQPVHGTDGSVQGVVLSLVDVTERKRAELMLEQQNVALQQLSETERRLRELAEALVGASVAVSSSLNLAEVLNEIIFSLQRTIPFRTANILLLEGGQLTMAHHWCTTVSPVHNTTFRQEYPLNRSAELEHILETKQPLLIACTSSKPGWASVAGMEWVAAYLAAPLIAGGEVIGVIDLSSDQSEAFNQGMVNQLMAFAAPAAVAIHNARLYTAEQRARQVAETLYDASLALTRSLELDEVLGTLLDYTQRLVPFDAAHIFLLDDEYRLTVRALLAKPTAADGKLDLNDKLELWDEPLLRSAVGTKSSLVISDADMRSGGDDGRFSQGARALLAIPMIANENAIGLVTIARMTPEPFSREHIQLAEAIVAQATVAVQNAWLFEQVRAGHERLQTLYHRLVDVQENERRHIARELHDDTSQALASTMISLRLLEQDADLAEPLRVRIRKEKEAIDRVLENLHRLAVNLHPAALDLLGLVASIEQLVNDYVEHYGMNIQFKATGFTEGIRLPIELETTVYRIVQEALNNVVRHAKTNNVDVIIEMRDKKVTAMVEDDGVGYDLNSARSGSQLGLISMQERAQMAGGTLRIESKIGGGTTVVVEIPNGD